MAENNLSRECLKELLTRIYVKFEEHYKTLNGRDSRFTNAIELATSRSSHFSRKERTLKPLYAVFQLAEKVNFIFRKTVSSITRIRCL